MKKFIMPVLTVVILVSMIFIGCFQKASETPPEPTPTIPQPTPTNPTVPEPTVDQPSKEQLNKATDIIMGHIARLLPPEYQGYYADRVEDSDATRTENVAKLRRTMR